MELTERILMLHHITIIGLTAVCAMMWVKINMLKKRLDRMNGAASEKMKTHLKKI